MPGVGLIGGRFGAALTIAPALSVLPWFQVTNDGFFDIIFESAPNRSKQIDVWLLWIVAQESPGLFGGKFYPMRPGGGKSKNGPAVHASQR
jgi:hypothetical protein